MTASDDCRWSLAFDLDERLALPSPPAAPSSATELARATRRLDAWQRHPLYRGAPDAFAARLAADGLDRAAALALLGESAEALAARAGSLASARQRIADALSGAGPADDPWQPLVGSLTADRFQSAVMRLAAPFVGRGLDTLAAALRRLDGRADSLLPAPEEALRLWAGRLPALLAPMFLRSIALEVNIARLKGTLAGDTPAARFDDFIEQLSRPSRRRDFFTEYSVLARQVDLCISHWAAFGSEFFGQLAADAPAIRAAFADGGDPGRLASIGGSDGDGHRSGRCVLKLGFAGGMRLVYKPRPLSLDRHFAELLRWFNGLSGAGGGLPPLRAMQVLDCGDHGWCEYIDAQPCQGAAQVERFFVRQGAFLALLYVLQAIDFHSENLIACGEHPVLVDLEALFHPDDIDFAAGDAFREPAAAPWLGSLLRIGLLPERQDSSDDVAGIDISGLGDRAGQVMAEPIPMIVGVATDAMHVAYERPALEPEASLPTLDGVRSDAAQHVAAIVDGFTAAYRLLLRHRDALLGEMLPRFAGDPIRFIAVPTKIYDRILKTSFHPDYLRDAIERERILDRVWRHADPPPLLQQLFRAERADLGNGDIPFFSAVADGRDLFDSRGARLTGILAESGHARACQRVRLMSEADLERQAWTLRASFATITLGHGDGTWPVARPTPSSPAVSEAELLELAVAAGDRILDLAYVDGDCAGWLGVSLIRDREWRVMPVGLDLYNGLAGIALFLAQLGRVSGESRFTAMARRAAQSIVRQFETRHGFNDELPIGVFGGLSGPVYAFVHLARLWHDDAWLAQAEAIAGTLPRQLAADRRFDLLDGSAGAIAGLLVLHHARPSAGVLGVARACGDHLLAHARHADGLVGLHWDNAIASSAPLTGLSHGAAGIALALLQLGAATGDSRYTDAGRAALAYERSRFVADAGNWPDLRVFPGADADLDPTPRHFMTTWCHGAPGIGMSRLMMRRVVDDPGFAAEIDEALRTTLRDGFGTNHSLCHGDLGNLDLVHAALVGEARTREVSRLGARVVASIRHDGWLTGVPLGIESPSLMCGLAGIGYGLLRLRDRDSVPSLLMLDPPAG